MPTQLFYYLDLARRSFLRHRVLTALMVVAIALGIGTSMTTLTVLHVLSRDPLPGKSERVYAVQLDAAGRENYRPGEEPDPQLTRYDAEALLAARRAARQALMSGGAGSIESELAERQPLLVDARYTSADFFVLFDVPFARGGPWSAADDAARARVAVITKELEEKLFGAGNGMGRSVRLDEHDLLVVGVLEHWRPTPHFYDPTTGAYGQVEQVFLPFSTALELGLRPSGMLRCWDDAGADTLRLGAPCSWVQFWVQLDTSERAVAYRDFLVSYSDEQRGAGRFARPPNVRLRNVMEWLDFQHVVPSDVRLQAWLAFAFLAVCLLDTVGLLLAKFLRRSQEIGVRRALGASRRAIIAQFLVEAGSVGLVGGVLGLGLAWLGLWAVRQQPVEYARLAELDLTMLGTSLALTLASSLLAGILPAWRAGQVAPALQLKSQ
ncbi:MAG: ABC transporter permease [Deltaproteobacteria bacterium]